MNAPAQDRERFTVRLARQVRDGDVVNAATPMTAAAALLARDAHGREAVVLHHGEVDPEPVPFAAPRDRREHAPTGTGAYGQADALQWIDAGRVDLMFVAPAEIDGARALNASRVGGRRLPGGVATADIVSLVGRIVAYRTGSLARSLVDEVQYKTASAAENAPGRRGVTALVVPGACIAWEDGRARLAGRDAGLSPARLREQVGFEFDPEGATEEPEPSAEELSYLRRLDPEGVGDLEVSSLRAEALRRFGLAGGGR